MTGGITCGIYVSDYLWNLSGTGVLSNQSEALSYVSYVIQIYANPIKTYIYV
jgi:hypothetical protein